MNMKLSYIDKVIFIVVMVLVVLIAGFFLFIKPKFAESETAKYNLQVKQEEKAEIDAKIETLPTIIDNMKKVAQEIDTLQEIFMEEQDPYLNEMYIRDALASLNVEFISMQTNYAEADDLDRYVVPARNVLAYENKINADLYNELPQEVYDKFNKVKAEAHPGAVVGITNMNISFMSDLELKKVYDVIDKLAGDEKTIILNSVSTAKEVDGDEPEVEVTADLTVYSIYHVNVEKVLEETTEVKPIEPAAEEAAETTAE